MDMITNIDKLRIKELEESVSNEQVLTVDSDGNVSKKNQEDLKNWEEVFNFPQVNYPYKKKPFIELTSSAREWSNIIYSNTLKKYVFMWSVQDSAYPISVVFLAVSDDLDAEWEVIGKILDDSEDPYIVEENGALYVFVERKVSGSIQHDDIGLWKLTDNTDLLNGWDNLGYILEKDPSKSWQGQDISSPTVFRENGVYYLFFEARGLVDGVLNQGAIGLATSNNIEGVFEHQDFIFSANSMPSRNSDINTLNIVPDDIFKINGYYYMTAHGINEVDGAYYKYVIKSKELTNGWEDYMGKYVELTNLGSSSSGHGSFYFEGRTAVKTNQGFVWGFWERGASSYDRLELIKYTDQEVKSLRDYIKIGARNYLLNSNNLPTNLFRNSVAHLPITTGIEDGVNWIAGTANNGRIDTYVSFTILEGIGTRVSNDFYPVEEYLCSVYVKSPIDRRVTLGRATGPGVIFTQLQANEWTRIEKFVTGLSESDRFPAINSDYMEAVPPGTKLYYKNYQVERGNKLTDYRQALEDFETDYEQTDNKYSNYLKGRDLLASKEYAIGLITSPDGTKRLQVNNDGTITSVDV